MIFTIPRKTRILWQIRIAFVLVVFCTVLVVFCHISLWFLLPTAIVITIGSAFVFIYIPLYFKSYKVLLYDNYLCIFKGVVIKTRLVLPHLRLVFIKSTTTPIASALNLKIIMLKIARGWIFIPEMNCFDANSIINGISGVLL